MKRDIEQVVAATAAFVITLIVTAPPPARPGPRRGRPRRRRVDGSGLLWASSISLLLGAAVCTAVVYAQDVAMCARFRLAPPPLEHSAAPLVPPEAVDLASLIAEALLLVVLTALAIRALRQRRLERS